jgi:hypothetical protein
MKKILLGLIVAIALALSIYWLKCQMGINLSGLLSLHNLPLFRGLQREEVIAQPAPGTLFSDSFDSFAIINHWSGLWMREKGRVTLDHDSQGRDGSRCLVIRSTSDRDWSYAHNRLIQVRAGEVFSFRGWAWLEGEKACASIGVSAFEGGRKAISWSYVIVEVDRRGAWVKVERTFRIPEGIAYIRFRLSGVGEGTFRFDDVRFEKERS